MIHMRWWSNVYGCWWLLAHWHRINVLSEFSICEVLFCVPYIVPSGVGYEAIVAFGRFLGFYFGVTNQRISLWWTFVATIIDLHRNIMLVLFKFILLNPQIVLRRCFSVFFMTNNRALYFLWAPSNILFNCSQSRQQRILNALIYTFLIVFHCVFGSHILRFCLYSHLILSIVCWFLCSLHFVKVFLLHIALSLLKRRLYMVICYQVQCTQLPVTWTLTLLIVEAKHAFSNGLDRPSHGCTTLMVIEIVA